MDRRVLSIAFVLVAAACNGNHDEQDAAADASTDVVVSDAGSDAPELVDGPNVLTVIVNQGLSGSNSVDEPFVSVTLCVPGTSQCETIDNVLVDTGSMGLRIMSTAITTLTLPTQIVAVDGGTGGTLAECEVFGDAYQWGSVRLADVKLGQEMAPNLPVHIVGDPGFMTVPPECSSLGSPQLTVAALGANGLLGINTFAYDCGPQCTGSNPLPAFYYSCDAGACTVAAAALDQQVINPIARLPIDNNGASLRFPAVAPEGAATLTGQIVFGIGTQSNNALGSATIIKVDAYGNFTTIYKGQAFTQSFIDTGTNSLSFPDGTIPRCLGQLSYLYCPSSPLALTAKNKGTDGVTADVSFNVESASQLFAMPFAAYDDLAGPGASGTFDWGFPFFIGRAVYVALLNATTPSGKGPFIAY